MVNKEYDVLKFQDRKEWTVLGPTQNDGGGEYRPHIAECEKEEDANRIANLLCDGSIPAGHFVCGCDLDADEPWFEISDPNFTLGGSKRRLPVPKELAYYLNTHWCGSKKMNDTIRENTRREIAVGIKDLLGLDEP